MIGNLLQFSVSSYGNLNNWWVVDHKQMKFETFVNLIITLISGCINSDRIINAAHYSFGNDLTTPSITVVGGGQVYLAC